MNKKRYNKLVRDNIPEIIINDKSLPKISTLNDKSFRKELVFKLLEESIEVIKAGDDTMELTKEIGDVYEVIDSIIEAFDLNREEILSIKAIRKEIRGGFKKKIFLEYVEEEK